jgi:hypothetical protein
MNNQQLARALSHKIAYEFDLSVSFQRLMFSVISQAVWDLVSPAISVRPEIRESTYRRMTGDARKFLGGTILHAELCGVDSDRIHWILKKAGIDLLQDA